MRRTMGERWRYTATSGRVRQWFHFVPCSVPLFVVTICTALYLEAAYAFLFDTPTISHVSVYDRLDAPFQQIVGVLMLLALLNVLRNPPQTGLLVVVLAVGLRGYDAIHVQSVAALTVYVPFLITVPPLFQEMRRR